VRLAIARAINRPGLNDAIMFGKAEVATSPLPSWSWAFDANLPRLESDPAQAGQLLDRAGWSRSGAEGIRSKNGQRLSLKFWSTPASFRPGLMAMIKDQLAQIGIEVLIDSFPTTTLFDASPGAPAQALAKRKFDIAEFAWVSSYDPGSDALYNMHSTNIPSQANGYRGGNYGDYKNPRIDQLLSQVQRSVDASFRVNALHEAQGIWQSDLPILPLLLRPITTATSTRLQGFRPTPANAGETWNIEQWDLLPPS
jgi:peptide/nickel transport system substrate-binding protein